MGTARRSTFLASSLLLILIAAGCGDGSEFIGPAGMGPDAQASASTASVVLVAPPTGDPATDVANIRAAFGAAEKNSTVQFASGTYTLGDNAVPIRIEPKGVSLIGHPAGTAIEGGTVVSSRVPVAFQLRGKQQSVRGISFRSFGAALVIGFANPDEGGYSVTDCTFSESYLPIQASHASGQITRITGNRFVNVFIPIQTLGDRFEFSWNTISVPDPSRIPVFGAPGNAGQFNSAFVPPLGRALNAEGNLIEHNTVDDYPDGYILASFPNSTIRGTIVRNNVHRNARLYTPIDKGTLVVPEAFGNGVTENNLIIGNTLIGSEGWGIFVFNSPGNRIIANTIRDVRVPAGADDRGIGIWVLFQSHGTQVLRNEFSGNERADVLLSADDNLVVLLDVDDSVIDEGQDNKVVGAGGGQNAVVAVDPGLSASVDQNAAVVEKVAQDLLRKARAEAVARPEDPPSPDVAVWWLSR